MSPPVRPRPSGRAPQGVRGQGGSRLSRYRAERLLRKDFAGLRAKVLAVVRAQLRGKGITLDPADLEACYAQAWHGLYATVLEGEPVENPSAWLVTVTFRRAIDEYRSASRTGIVGEGEMGSFPRESIAQAADLAADLDDRTRLRQVFEALRTRLSARECEAASLCYLQGLSRAEAAQCMNVSEARMRKLMEGAGPGRPGVAGMVGELLETIKAGGWCEQQSSLMRAYAFGILDPEGERHALAVAHCRECPACRAHVASLRGLASVLPLPLISPLALAGAGGAANASGAGRPKAGTSGTVMRTRVARAGLGIGRRATGGLNGVAGSLTTKLALTAIILVGAGYTMLGSRAHGNPPRHSASSSAAGPPRGASLVPPPVPFWAFGAHTGRAPTGRRLPAAHARSRRSSTTKRSFRSLDSGSLDSGEFSPERLRREQTAARLASVPPSTLSSSRPPSGSAGTAGEFGIE